MKLYITETEDGVSTCTSPFKENAVVATQTTVTTEEMGKATSSDWVNKIENGQLVFEEAPEPPLSTEEQARQDLKQKMENGTATQQDIVNALKLIL